jgi:hypothetical protein
MYVAAYNTSSYSAAQEAIMYSFSTSMKDTGYVCRHCDQPTGRKTEESGSFTVWDMRLLSSPQPEELNSGPSQPRVQRLQRVLYTVILCLRCEAGLIPPPGEKVKFTLEQAMKAESWSRV